MPFKPHQFGRKQEIYCLEEIEIRSNRPTGFYKLGMTTRDTEQRKREYKAGNPRELRTIHVTVVPNAQIAETTMHDRFVGRRLTGNGGGDEFFEFRPNEIENVIREMNMLAGVAPNHSNPLKQALKEAFSGFLWTLTKTFDVAKWTVRPIAKVNRRSSLIERASMFPIAWLVLAVAILKFF